MTERKIPMRTCVVSREKLPKKELIRVVRNKDGEVFVDETGNWTFAICFGGACCT